MNQLMPPTIDVSATSEHPSDTPERRSAQFKVTVIAIVSALTGGLAAAWFYRRTLTRLHHAELNGRDSNFGMAGSPDDDGA